MCAPGGVSAPGWRVSVPGGVCSWGCLLLGSLLLGGVCSRGRVSTLGGGIPTCTEADPPMDKMTDTSKNITFTTLLRTVIRESRATLEI